MRNLPWLYQSPSTRCGKGKAADGPEPIGEVAVPIRYPQPIG